MGTVVVFALGLFLVSSLVEQCGSSNGGTSPGTTTAVTTPDREEGREATPSATTSPDEEQDAKAGAPETTEDAPQSEPSQSETQQRDRSDYRQQYVNDWVLDRLRSDDRPVVLVAMEGKTPFESRLVRKLRSNGMNAQAGLLKPAAFQSDELHRRLAGGDAGLLHRLGLAQLSGRLVLCRLTFGELTETRDGYTTDAYLSVTAVPLSGGHPTRRTFEAPGGGFTPADAEEQAQERVLGDLLDSTLVNTLTR
jgi:hypothetical protein